ncbi:hypothetical protein [Agrilutibacter solisilvae]|uniref:Uncharacterized protein n=1 Tax=Agrilutibacter solisilvae TaxID=2763317 RepID=A0A974XXY4_9GAMM|nr:hypothetical protein [Lysobacter solisilvae]QSX77698.1 hypothetical protein I8J32_013250 [Lysobacter solisilvae]
MSLSRLPWLLALATSPILAQQALAQEALAQEPPASTAPARHRLEARRLSEARIEPRLVRELQVSTVAADQSLVSDRVRATDLHVALPDASTAVDSTAVDAAAVDAVDGATPGRAVADAAGAASTPSVDQVTLDLTRLGTRIGDLKQTTLFDRGVRVPLPAGSDEVTLQRGQILAIGRHEDAAQVITAGITTASSPSVLYTVDRQLRARELGLVHKTAGLNWDGDKRRFMGQILVGIIDRENAGASEPIDATLTVQLLAPGNSLTPALLEIHRIGQPFQSVEVALEAPDDPFEVQLLSQVDPDLPPARLSVRRTQLVLSAPTLIDGLGVGSGEVTVRSAGARLREGETITLHLDRGRLESSTLVVGANGVATTRIHSTTLGDGTLRLEPGPYVAQPVQLRFVPPWPLIAATLLGSALGTFILVYALRQRTPRRRRSYMPDAVAGMVVGIGATSMVYAGMALPDWVPLPQSLAGAIAPFALSFFCAAAGSALIGWLSGTRIAPVAAAPEPASTG